MPGEIAVVTVSDDKKGRIKKMLLKAGDGASFEAARFWTPEINRYDLCISSMAGCLMGCKICGCTYNKMANERKLSSAEIIEQVDLLMKDGEKFIVTSKKPSPCYIGFEGDKKNQYNTSVLIGFMGNGDPFCNIREVMKAINDAQLKYGNKITRFGISTIGPRNINLADSLQDLTAFSRNRGIDIWMQYSAVSMDEEIRRRLIPGAVPLREAVAYMDKYAIETGVPVRYNFPMINGVNDSIDHLDKLVKFILQKPSLRAVKLSTYNEISKNEFEPCSIEEIKEKGEYLKKQGVKVDVFLASNDKNISAACGQMRNNVNN